MLIDEGSQMRVSSCDDDRSWDAAPPGGNDAVLRWLEAFASVLKDQLGCCHLHERMNSFGICLHPAHEPWQVGLQDTVDHVLLGPQQHQQNSEHPIHEHWHVGV